MIVNYNALPLNVGELIMLLRVAPKSLDLL